MSDIPPVTIRRTPCVQVIIQGKEQERRSGRPMVRDDGDLIGRLLKWMSEESIIAIACTSIGGGQMLAYFSEADAERVMIWLEDKGLTEEG